MPAKKLHENVKYPFQSDGYLQAKNFEITHYFYPNLGQKYNLLMRQAKHILNVQYFPQRGYPN